MPIACDAQSGCTNPNACNYDPNAQLGDDTCIFATYCETCPDADGVTTCLDIAGCDPDDCGTCGGFNDCCSGVLDCNQECDGTAWMSDCGCVTADNSGDECDDCLGIPNGSNWISDCGCVPYGNAGNNCDDCAGVPWGDSQLDECGVCNGDGTSCDASILLTGWQIDANIAATQFEPIFSNGFSGYQDMLEANLNCDMETDTILGECNYDSDIDSPTFLCNVCNTTGISYGTSGFCDVYAEVTQCQCPDVIGSGGPPCQAGLIESIPDMGLKVRVAPWGAGFDVEEGEVIPGFCYYDPETFCNTCTTTGISYGQGDCDVYAEATWCECPDISPGDLKTTLSDLTINMDFAVHIKREVSVTDTYTGEVTQTDCHDIFGTEASPRISNTFTYDPSTFGEPADAVTFDLTFPIIDSGDHTQCYHDCDNLTTGIHFFNYTPVEGIELNDSTYFDAVYYVKIYLNDYEILGYNPDWIANNITANDIYSPIEFTLEMHHYPQDWSTCDGFIGDTYGDNDVDCDDFSTAMIYYIYGLCEDWQTGTTNAPPGCCNAAAADGNPATLTQDDLDIILEMIMQNTTGDCS